MFGYPSLKRRSERFDGFRRIGLHHGLSDHLELVWPDRELERALIFAGVFAVWVRCKPKTTPNSTLIPAS
jgi:hypothetical protein